LFVLVVFTTLVLPSLGFFFGCHRASITKSNQGSPEDALKRFYSNKGPEDTLMDPLILAGDTVVPEVLTQVTKKNMPRRRYAIGFLGNGSYKEALPVLEVILQDPNEEDYIRGDALQSIYMIDESRGRGFAQRYRDHQDYLGDISRRVIAGDSQLKMRRTYSQAAIGKHE
jgi:hypothetical protein